MTGHGSPLAYPLQWPIGWPRTAAHRRQRAKFGRKDTETRDGWTSARTSKPAVLIRGYAASDGKLTVIVEAGDVTRLKIQSQGCPP